MSISKKERISINEFLENKNTNIKKRPIKKQKKKASAIIKITLLLVFIIALLSVTFDNLDFSGVIGSARGSIANVFTVQKKTSSQSFNSIKINKKPAWPGCAAVSFKKLSTEQISNEVCPSVVGIIQYKQNSIKESGEGSGIILSSDGYIVTNNHVVDGAINLKVVFKDGKEIQAQLIGKDTRTDIAVIKVNKLNLVCAEFGNSDECKVGEQVVAIGNPSGLKLAGSVTQGIISALNRNIDVGNGPMNLIQTDAAINPGNSGGALVNMYGQVVGINSAKISQQGYEGIGFSIPINTAKTVVDSILQYGYVKGRVRFGFDCREIDSVTAKLNSIPEGVYIDSVDPSSNAAQSGLKADDIITQINNKTIKTTDELILERDKHKPNELLTIHIYRRITKEELNITIMLMEDRGDIEVSNNTGAEQGSW
jgi:serine protease Do